MYLKRKYGEGYNLIIELTSRADESELREEQRNVLIWFILYSILFILLFRIQDIVHSIQWI